MQQPCNNADGDRFVPSASIDPIGSHGDDSVARLRHEGREGGFEIRVPARQRRSVLGHVARRPLDASVIDLAPTILHWLGHEVPADMDGRVLTQVMNDEYVRDHPVRLAEASGDQQARGDRDYTAEEEGEIMNRLRDLGYMN